MLETIIASLISNIIVLALLAGIFYIYYRKQLKEPSTQDGEPTLQSVLEDFGTNFSKNLTRNLNQMDFSHNLILALGRSEIQEQFNVITQNSIATLLNQKETQESLATFIQTSLTAVLEEVMPALVSQIIQDIFQPQEGTEEGQQAAVPALMGASQLQQLKDVSLEDMIKLSGLQLLQQFMAGRQASVSATSTAPTSKVAPTGW